MVGSCRLHAKLIACRRNFGIRFAPGHSHRATVVTDAPRRNHGDGAIFVSSSAGPGAAPVPPPRAFVALDTFPSRRRGATWGGLIFPVRSAVRLRFSFRIVPVVLGEWCVYGHLAYKKSE